MGKPNGSKRWAFMSKFVIPNLDNPTETYLTRWRIIQTPWFALYLHRMGGPDSRDTLHDHPWNFTSVVLRGGYVERRLNTHDLHVNDVHMVRRVNRMRTHDAHAISRLLRIPTWTLVCVGRRVRMWGYWEPMTWNHWRWTPYDKHKHAREFDEALAARNGS